MKNSSQKSDLIGNFLTLSTEELQQGFQKPGQFLREALQWWSTQSRIGNSGLYFLHPLDKDSGKEWKFFLQLRGQNTLKFEDYSFQIPPGSMCLFPADPRVTEIWEPDTQVRYSHVFIGIFPGRISANFVDGNPPKWQSAVSIPFTQGSLLDRMIHFSSTTGKAPAHQGQVIVDILLEGMRISGQDAPSRLVRHCMEWILDQPCNPDLSVKWLAQQLNCHPDYLSRRFHLETGTSLMSYVRSKRMEIAADLLTAHQMTVADVAASCGYRDHSYFTRIFHQTYGVVPSQWGGK